MFMISIPVIMISVNDWDMQSYNKIPKSQEKSRKHTANRPSPAHVNPFPGWGMTRAMSKPMSCRTSPSGIPAGQIPHGTRIAGVRRA